jgi:hypothetical protein
MKAEQPGWGPFTKWHLLLPAILAAVLTAYIINESMAQGRLGTPPVHDDVSYMMDGARRLLVFYDKGVSGAVREYIHQPPHAPVFTAMAATGFLLFGIHEWAPYVMNSLVALLFFAIAAYIMRQARPWQRLLTLVALAMIPAVSMSVREFRPDIAAALLTVLAIILIIEQPLRQAAGRRLVLIGALFGAAILTKPSTFPLTLALFVGCLALAALVDDTPSSLVQRLYRGFLSGLLALAALIAVAGPHFALTWRRMVGYIETNIFGVDRDLWTVSGNTLFHARYYIDGKAGGFMLGPYAWSIVAIAAAGALLAAFFDDRGGRRRSLVLAAALLVTYASASLNEVKSEFLGLPFQILLLFTALLTVRLLLVEGRRKLLPRIPWTQTLLVILTALSVWHYRPWSRWPPPPPHLRPMSEEIYQSVRREMTPPRGIVFITFDGRINNGTLRFRALQDRHPIHFTTNINSRTFEDFYAEALRARIIIAAEPGTWFSRDRLPTAQFGQQIIDALEANPDYGRIDTIPIGETDKSVFIFKRVR